MGKASKIKGHWIVLAFALLMVFFLANEGESAEIEVGPTFLSGDYAEGGIILLSERVGVWSFAGGYVSEQFVNTCGWGGKCFDNDLQENIFFQVQRVIEYKRYEIGIGPAYFQSTNRALGTSLVWAVSLGYGGDHWSIRFRHYSNAGSGTPNLGQDALTIGYAF